MCDDLFGIINGCETYQAVRDRQDLEDIREECLRLWKIYGHEAAPHYREEFANNFFETFWEMYIFDKLAERCKRLKCGPDFFVDNNVYLEVTVAGPGSGENVVSTLIPEDPECEETSFIPAIDKIILRITSAFEAKADFANGITDIGKKAPVVIAINLPYRQANDCNIGGGLGVRALFGYSQDILVKNQSGTWEAILSSSPTVVKANGASVRADNLLDPKYSHISGVVLAAVTPFSSTYIDPPFELIHNPHANYPIPEGWLGFGSEFLISEGVLHCRPSGTNEI